MRPRVSHWVATGFCAFISYLALFASATSGTNWALPAFFAFLPMCFFFVAGVTSQLQREVGQLRRRVEELEEAQARTTPQE
jgi:hypothetical protein